MITILSFINTPLNKSTRFQAIQWHVFSLRITSCYCAINLIFLITHNHLLWVSLSWYSESLIMSSVNLFYKWLKPMTRTMKLTTHALENPLLEMQLNQTHLENKYRTFNVYASNFTYTSHKRWQTSHNMKSKCVKYSSQIYREKRQIFILLYTVKKRCYLTFLNTINLN